MNCLPILWVIAVLDEVIGIETSFQVIELDCQVRFVFYRLRNIDVYVDIPTISCVEAADFIPGDVSQGAILYINCPAVITWEVLGAQGQRTGVRRHDAGCRVRRA